MYKQFFPTVGIAALIGGILWFLTELIFISVVAALVASIVTFYLASVMIDSPDNNNDGNQADQQKRPTPDELENELASVLATAKTAGVNKDVDKQLTEAIDKLRDLLPELHKQYPDAKITWTMNRMATTYIPDIIEPYVDLSKKQRNNRKDNIMSSLRKLDAKIDDVRDLVDNQKENEFEKEAQFIEVEFLNEGDQ